MQVHVHSPAGPGPGYAGAADIEALVRDLIGSEGRQVVELDVRPCASFDDETVDDDMHCRLHARLRDGTRLSANHAAPTLVQALHGAVRQIRVGLQRLDMVVLG